MYAVTISLRTRLKRIQVEGFFRNLPAILAGNARDPHKLRSAFLGGFCQSFFTDLSAAFEAKSLGGTDELGNKWSPLKKSTIRARLNPKMQARFPLSRNLWVMRLGERLLRSLRPGDIVGGRYNPPAEQVAKMKDGEIILGTGVPYAPRQDAMRPIFPRRIKPWVDRATDAGIRALSQRIREVLTSNTL